MHYKILLTQLPKIPFTSRWLLYDVSLLLTDQSSNFQSKVNCLDLKRDALKLFIIFFSSKSVVEQVSKFPVFPCLIKNEIKSPLLSNK